jgi:cell division septum initiation protein DivIVA
VTGLPDGSDAALAHVRTALQDAARESATRIAEDAAEQAAAMVAEAQREADRLRAAAAENGAAAARSEAALRSARVRRQAHEIVLARQSALRSELQRQVRNAATALRGDPRYPELVDRLGDQCRAVLGPETTVTESVDGGVVARSGTRRLDLSLPVLAVGTLESMAGDVSALWTL